VSEKVTNDWKQVAADLRTNAAALNEIQAALAKTVLNNQLDLSVYGNIKFTHLSRPKSVANWFGAATQLSLHQGRHRNAADFLVSQIGLPRLLAEDRMLISELVRITLAGVVWSDTWEALQADGWTDEDLLRLQRAWEAQGFIPEMAWSFEGERIIYDTWHEAMRASNAMAYDGLFRWNELPQDAFNFETHDWVTPPLTFAQHLGRAWRKHVHARLWRFAWSHQAQHHGLAAIHALTEIGRSAATNGSHFAVKQAINQWTNQYYNTGFYSRLRLLDHGITTMPRSLEKAMRAQTQRSLAIAAIALKRYYIRHDDYPRALKALVPDFLSAVPLDFMDGQSVKYRREDDRSFLLYSVGEDGKDDGGDLSLPADKPNARQLWLRKDYVWPAPATPEEIEEYRREALHN